MKSKVGRQKKLHNKTSKWLAQLCKTPPRDSTPYRPPNSKQKLWKNHFCAHSIRSSSFPLSCFHFSIVFIFAFSEKHENYAALRFVAREEGTRNRRISNKNNRVFMLYKISVHNYFAFLLPCSRLPQFCFFFGSFQITVRSCWYYFRYF